MAKTASFYMLVCIIIMHRLNQNYFQRITLLLAAPLTTAIDTLYFVFVFASYVCNRNALPLSHKESLELPKFTS